MKTLLAVLSLIIITINITAQTTYGDKSPVIIGAKGKVNYVKERSIQRKVPPELSHYLAGLLISNNINAHTSSLNAALDVWFKKYNELKTAIDKVQDANLKNQAKLRLAEGNFTEVESIIKTKTNYSSLLHTFPKTYQTSGSESPIIVGDYGSVTYVVKEIITYKLPEGLTVNLLNELKSKDNLVKTQRTQLGNLQSTIENRESVIKDYISRYNLVKEKLKNSPSQIYQRAYAAFSKGNLTQALKELDLSAQHDKSYGESSILKAKILLLQLNYNALDSSLREIDKSYNIGVQLNPNGDNTFEYGKFLSDYAGNYPAAIVFFEKSYELTTDQRRKVEILNYLGIAYSTVDRIKANDFHEKALVILEGMEPIQDKSLIVTKSLILSNLAAGYASGYFDIAMINKSIAFSKRAIEELDKLPTLSEEDQYRKALYYNQHGKEYAMIADTNHAIACYNNALSFLEDAAQRKPYVFTIGLTSVYYNMAALYSTTGQPLKAIEWLSKAITLTEPKITPGSRIYLVATVQLYSALVSNYASLNMLSNVMASLNTINALLAPFVASDPKTFLIQRAALYTDLGNIYLNTNNIDSAQKYISGAYDYYSNNFSAAQFNKQKFALCINLMNEIQLRTGQTANAALYNRNLLTKLTNSAVINKFVYDDFIPQIYAQLAKVYATTNQKDSALFYIDAALNLVEPKAKQYGTTYLYTYFTYAIQGYGMSLKFKDYQNARTRAQSFRDNCTTILNVDPFVKANMQAVIGECISGFSVVTFQYTQDPATGILPATDLNNLYLFAEEYFNEGEKYYIVAVQRNKNETLKYAQALYYAAFLQYYWATKSNTAAQQQSHADKKCAIIKKVDALLKPVPVNQFVTALNNQLAFINTGCN
ncbi:hypothetical protein [Chitinophaga sp. MM2321]|uniref:tetratricopeptide repeat protein n=1 Tax=Chitinophaga sp. MM2321 TaxID=3137178 RepID=UPI0032D5927A